MISSNMQSAMRSLQTIRDCTRVVASYPTKHSDLQVLELVNDSLPVDKQTYIAVFQKDIGGLNSHVKPLAEARFVNGKVFFTVKPKKQYPNLSDTDYYTDLIKTGITDFIRKHTAQPARA